MLKIKSNLIDKAMVGYDEEFALNIGRFLHDRKSFLWDYTVGYTKAPNIINHYSKAYNLNQRIILMTVQKEQGAIESVGMLPQIKIDKICGCGVLEKGEVIEKYKGFENQIAGACAIYRKWYDYFNTERVAKLTDGKGNIVGEVECETAITYSLLRYTPSIEKGLILAERVYERYFDGFTRSI